MFRLLLMSLLVFFTIHQANAQEFEVGGWIGSGTYFGDLNPGYNVSQSRPALGIVGRYNVNPYVAFKLNAGAAMIQHADSISKNPFPKRRNLSFKSNVFELTGQIELNFHRFTAGSDKNYFTPYITAGVGLFYYNPKAKYEGEWYNLVEVGTEGQNVDFGGQTEPYKRLQLAIPLGIGIKYWMRSNWTFFAEVAYRFTNTDYLDDVSGTYVDTYLLGDGTLAAQLSDRSGEVGEPIGREGGQRGDATNNDAYVLLNIGVTYTIFNTKCPQGKPKQYYFE